MCTLTRFNYRLPKKLREGNVFTGVCHSVQVVRLAETGGAYSIGIFSCYRLPMKLQEGNVFISLCLFTGWGK